MDNGLYEKMKIVLKESGFDSVFKTPSADDRLSRIGTKNPDGSYTVGKHTIHPEQQSKYPILSHKFEDNIYDVERLDGIPTRARATGRVIAELAERGVEWIQFSQLKLIPPDKYAIGSGQHQKVNSGLQAVGKYKSIGIIYETKVGVRNPSAGFIIWVGPFSDIQQATGSIFGSSGAALKDILRILDAYSYNLQKTSEDE